LPLNLINHANGGPKNKLRIESIRKYPKKNIGLKKREDLLDFSKIKIKVPNKNKISPSYVHQSKALSEYIRNIVFINYLF